MYVCVYNSAFGVQPVMLATVQIAFTLYGACFCFNPFFFFSVEHNQELRAPVVCAKERKAIGLHANGQFIAAHHAPNYYSTHTRTRTNGQ